MGLIDKACRLRDVRERGDTLSKHRCGSFQSMATQVFAGRTSKKTFEHTGKMNRMDPDSYCDPDN
ncbi:hypothetical protein ASG20_06820 [Sphingomonas sp. Leaf198]|nr:hypothetical protein ASG20_06820 [Sphingomonas sp. Leaf198]